MTAARAITCPACGGTIEVRAAGFSVNLACVHCGSLLDVSRPEVALIERHAEAARAYALPLGTRGVLYGDEWAVVGATLRSDGEASWQEFLLFNPYRGYRWLVLFEGDWQFGTPLTDRPQGDGVRIVWRGEGYAAVSDPTVTTNQAVAGEFYWRLAAGDTAQCTLFERGDEVLSRECTADEENWTHLVPVPGALIAEAFGPAPTQPGRRRSAPQGFSAAGAKPQRETGDRDDLVWMFGLATITAIVALFAMVLLAGPVSVVTGRIQVPVGSRTLPERIGTITVTRPYQFVTITADTDDFHNRWVDLDYSLVDRATQQSTDAYGLVEYYTGTDSDGAWSEGSHRTETMISRVPRGTYDVYVGAEAHGWPSDPVQTPDAWYGTETISVKIDARTGAMSWGMWVTLLLGLLAWPGLILWWRNREDD